MKLLIAIGRYDRETGIIMYGLRESERASEGERERVSVCVSGDVYRHDSPYSVSTIFRRYTSGSRSSELTLSILTRPPPSEPMDTKTGQTGLDRIRPDRISQQRVHDKAGPDQIEQN